MYTIMTCIGTLLIFAALVYDASEKTKLKKQAEQAEKWKLKYSKEALLRYNLETKNNEKL